MEQKQIIVVKTGSIFEADKQELKQAGYIVLECANPDEVHFLYPSISQERNIILKAALKALKEGSTISQASQLLVNELNKHL